MRKISVDTFARHFKQVLQEQEKSFAFFLGAGCSMPDIPGAAALVRQWHPKLHMLETGGTPPFEEWSNDCCKNHDENNPAASYAEIMQRLFWMPADRQQEIERIALRKDPGFAYAVLAKLLSHREYGHRCNLVLTTNFDDMVADALYVYSAKKPLVVVHESLVEYVDTGRSRPTVIKLHGDALLSPKNLEEETKKLTPEVQKVLAEQIAKRGLIFIGYGGNDKSVTSFFKDLSDDAFSSGIYWINDQVPKNEFGAWLRANPNGVWVNHLRFNELMVLIRKELQLDHPDDNRFSQLMTRYKETLADLDREVLIKPHSSARDALSSAVEQAVKEFENWWAVELEVRRHIDIDPDEADKIYRSGLDQFPDSPQLLGNYAIFLQDKRQDMDKAESCYTKAIKIDPDDANNLGNYALFLEHKRQNDDKAESYYTKAIDVDPNHANNLGNYALFLEHKRQNEDKAESYYTKAIDVDPNHANNLGNYGLFLQNVRQDMDKAESYYTKAIDADPNHANNLGNYGLFLQNVRQDMDKAEVLFTRAIEADPNHVNNLVAYAIFLWKHRQKIDQAESLFKQVFEAESNNATYLGANALFLWQGRQETDEAEVFFKRAIEADPNHPNNFCNYSGFLLAQGRTEEGLMMLQKALPQLKTPSQLLEVQFYQYAHAPAEYRPEALREIKRLIGEGARSHGWDFSANIARSKEDEHPNVPILKALAAVIADDAEPSTLDAFEEWQNLS